MSYRNQVHVRIKTYRALKKFKCFIHIFNLVYPQLAPSYIVKEKVLLLYMHAYACITPFLNFPFFFFYLLHTCNLNFCYILKSNIVSRPERSEFCTLCISILLWLLVLYLQLVGSCFCFIARRLRAKYDFINLKLASPFQWCLIKQYY